MKALAFLLLLIAGAGWTLALMPKAEHDDHPLLARSVAILVEEFHVSERTLWYMSVPRSTRITVPFNFVTRSAKGSAPRRLACSYSVYVSEPWSSRRIMQKQGDMLTVHRAR